MTTVLMEEPTATSNDHDQELKRRIVNYLVSRNRHSLLSLEIDVKNGLVAIKGRVDSFYERQLCINCCQRVAGVIRLIDQIEVAVVA